MPESPKSIVEKVQMVINAWQTLRPAKSFAGMQLEQFKERVKPSFDARATVATLENQLLAAKDQREAADKASLAAAQFVIHAVKGDPDEGENGEMYSALGYVRKSERRSGLHRGRKAPAGAAAGGAGG